MFLDEKLEYIHCNYDGKEKCFLLLETMIDSFKEKKEGMDSKSILQIIKQIDNSWRLFCSHHSNCYNEEAWRRWVLKSDEKGILKDVLRW